MLFCYFGDNTDRKLLEVENVALAFISTSQKASATFLIQPRTTWVEREGLHSGMDILDHWLSTLPVQSYLNTVAHAVVTPNHKIISLLLHSCNFAAVMNQNVDI